MRVDLDTQELEMLQRVVEQRMDVLLGQLSATDSLSFKESLKQEHHVLQSLYGKLGCERPERSMARSCSTAADIDLDQMEALRPEDVG